VMPQNEAQVLADFCESSVHGGSLLHAACPDTPYARYWSVVSSQRSNCYSRGVAALEKPFRFANIRSLNRPEDDTHP
jgi:hypothetical protein